VDKLRGVARFEVGVVIVQVFTVLVGIGFVAYVVWALVEVMRAMKADEAERGRDRVDDR
jgi:phage shock protein PspC (stress-responsive transcriptional regulator)